VNVEEIGLSPSPPGRGALLSRNSYSMESSPSSTLREVAIHTLRHFVRRDILLGCLHARLKSPFTYQSK
jgi:hypothetical protein